MNFREQLKDPTDSMNEFFKTGLVVMEADDKVTDKDLTEFASQWGELCPQASKFWYNGNSQSLTQANAVLFDLNHYVFFQYNLLIL